MAKRQKTYKEVSERHAEILKELEALKKELALNVGLKFIDDFDIKSEADYKKFKSEYKKIKDELKAFKDAEKEANDEANKLFMESLASESDTMNQKLFDEQTRDYSDELSVFVGGSRGE